MQVRWIFLGRCRLPFAACHFEYYAINHRITSSSSSSSSVADRHEF